jgi:hypothetical protein
MRRLRRITMLILAAAFAAPALASGWQGLYTPSPRAGASGMEIADSAVCVREILKAQLRYSIPGNILLGIGLQEAGTRRNGVLTIWPWSVNASGVGRAFGGRDTALSWVAAKRAEGTYSVDIGCMQVNLRWHPNAFTSVEAGFDPAKNVDYAARFLRDLYEKTGSWETAAGSYHSFTPEKRAIYLQSLRQNLALANARIDDFRALAGQARPRNGMASAGAEQPVTSAIGLFWTSGLSALQQGDQGVRSLYSDRDLQPILPNFIQEPE